MYGRRKYGFAVTTVMSTRGCPYRCEFCSNVVFGGSYRSQSAENVVDEIEKVLELGYDRVAFADDLFTLKKARVLEICAQIHHRKLRFSWECLARVDAVDRELALEMKEAGCTRIYFGVESGNDHILELMEKKITPEQARQAVEVCRKAGLEVGAFFILYYPGETDETTINTLRFATSLPLDYLGLTMPYILPGTSLYERVKDRIGHELDFSEIPLVNNAPVYDQEHSKTKMKLAIWKGQLQFRVRRYLGKLAPLFLTLFEKPTDELIRLLK
jgi:anaerobic magnesium-protoporphyrin IX monomethyl ester cyclase